MDDKVRIGTAGWNIPRPVAQRFPADGPVLGRYARVLNAAEINTSFYRPHRRATYERWAAATPDGFAFAVKLPRQVTHERRLAGVDEPLVRFLGEIEGLGRKLGAVLIQLPPSLGFDQAAAGFLRRWRLMHPGSTVCEPRHPTWFESEADDLMAALRIARVAADPTIVPAAATPGGWRGLTYLRWHGSPRMYASAYPPERLAAARRMLDARPEGTPAWAIFDNTMSGAAAANALDLAGI